MDRKHPTDRPMTLEEYLAFEERSVVKHEYVGGEVYAMSGVSTRHNLITLNIATALRAPARPLGCKVFATDVKLRVSDRVYYPDVMVACGSAAAVELIVEAPSLVVEVTSPSTRATDRREKLQAYRDIPDLDTYLIVDQRRRQVIAYARPEGDWSRAEYFADDVIPLPALDAQLALADIYEGVELPPLAVGETDWDDGWEEE